MDFPIFHLDFFGNRLLIAIDAILHVLINHPFAVGGLPVVALLEWQGIRRGDERWDQLAYSVLKVFFIITTTVGALSGVGVWFSASLVNPASIGSLIRVFFWAWFTEWLVFVTEVCLILLYFLTWKQAAASPEAKLKHQRVGASLAVFSWITMALIVAILGFMMDPGNWLSDRSFITAVFNPVYLPQLAFRTALAMTMGGLAVSCLTYLFCARDVAFRNEALRFVAIWTGCWMVPLSAAAVWYYQVIPQSMLGNIAVAIGTQAFASWQMAFKQIMAGAFALTVVVVALNFLRPGRAPAALQVVSFVAMLALIGHFERVREFIRKPYVIGNYMYANGFRVEDYPLLKRDGVLKHATFASVREITAENEVRAGREVFMLTCTRCHTVDGVNGVRGQLSRMYGAEKWRKEAIVSYLGSMHGARYYMPPFPGNKAELNALGAYLTSLRDRRDVLQGAQTAGLPRPDANAGSTNAEGARQASAVDAK